MAMQLTLPQVPFGGVSISRLILGGNPMGGGSHMSFMVNHPMREYYTPERVQEVLRRSQEQGINTWQSSGGAVEHYRRYQDAGGRLHYLSLESEPARIPVLVEAGALGVAFHGEVTDQLYRAGKLEQVNDFLKRARDAGMQVGVSTHIPEVVDAIEAKGWDLDYYMCCVYQRHRTREELRALLGEAPLPVPEVYLENDPDRMFRAIRQTKRTCLAFKILAAGRLCDRPEDVEDAFRRTFAGIKPTDAVIVGMYPRYTDQIAENAGLTRRYGAVAEVRSGEVAK